MFVVHLLYVGGVDDAGQLCSGLQSSHRLDPASREVGENGCPEQVSLFKKILIFILFCFFLITILFCLKLLPEVKLEMLLVSLSHKLNRSIVLALFQMDPHIGFSLSQ